MGPGGPRGMMEPGGTQDIVSRHSSVQTVTVGSVGRTQDIVSELEVCSQICPPDLQLTTEPELAVRAVRHCTTCGDSIV